MDMKQHRNFTKQDCICHDQVEIRLYEIHLFHPNVQFNESALIESNYLNVHYYMNEKS